MMPSFVFYLKRFKTKSSPRLSRHTTSATSLLFTTAANHLSTAVSELPEFVLRQRLISAVRKATIYNSDGSINTGNIDGWWKLSYSDRSKVWGERKRLGIKSPTKSANNSRNKENSEKGNIKNMQNRLKQLENSNTDYKRKIKAMKKTVQFQEEEVEEYTPDHAADEFGGCNSKKSMKT